MTSADETSKLPLITPELTLAGSLHARLYSVPAEERWFIAEELYRIRLRLTDESLTPRRRWGLLRLVWRLQRFLIVTPRLIRSCVASLSAAIAVEAHAGPDKPWAELEGSEHGDPLVGIALLVLGYGVLKLLASGDLIPLLRDVAKAVLFVYAPLAFFLGIFVASILGLQAAGISKEASGRLALPFAALCTWVTLSWLIFRGGGEKGSKGADDKGSGPTSTAPTSPLLEGRPSSISSTEPRTLEGGKGLDGETAIKKRVGATAAVSGQLPRPTATAAKQLTLWCKSCGHCIRGTAKPTCRFFDVRCPGCRTLLRFTAKGDPL